MFKKLLYITIVILISIKVYDFLYNKIFITKIDDSKSYYEQLKEYPRQYNNIEGKYRLEIPSINLNIGVLEGKLKDFDNLLLKSACTYTSNNNPTTENKNITIFAHRNGYEGVNYFYYINHIKMNDIIKLTYNNKVYEYEVIEKFITSKDADWILKDLTYNSLTLYSCHPLNDTKQRYVIRAKQINN